MIGVILSAGMGTRLRPLTDEIPKPLLEINDMTLLERMIKNYEELGLKVPAENARKVMAASHFDD